MLAKMAVNANTGAGIVQMVGNTLTQQKTEVDAVAGVLTFSANIDTVEIYNTDTNGGIFTVNGLNIKVPAGQVYKSSVAGTSSNIVTVTGATTYIISIYV